LRPHSRGAAFLASPAYSRFVRLAKIILPAAAVLLVGLMVIWPEIRRSTDRFHLSYAKIDPREADSRSMVNPRYFSVDNRNHPFSMTADIATQSDPQGTLVILNSPRADISLKDGSGALVNSDLGYYHQKEQTLDLLGNVDLYHDKGYELHTHSASVDINAGVTWGNEPTQGHGTLGQITSEGFRVGDNGQIILFTGHAHMIIEPKSDHTTKSDTKTKSGTKPTSDKTAPANPPTSNATGLPSPVKTDGTKTDGAKANGAKANGSQAGNKTEKQQ